MSDQQPRPNGLIRRCLRCVGASMKRHRCLVGVVVLAVLALAAAYASLWHYPRIVRSAYYRNPCYVCRAVAAEYRGRVGLPKQRAVARAPHLRP
ncbi:MAG: hypothetical protein JXA57_12050 [Armatimonadetes bacterium]|nr:hypothetical protein [Armatimonadota bacterium]